jgi:hypothetical protein
MTALQSPLYVLPSQLYVLRSVLYALRLLLCALFPDRVVISGIVYNCLTGIKRVSLT